MELIFVEVRQPVRDFFVSGVVPIGFAERDGGLLSLNTAKHFNVFSLYLFDLLLAKGCI